MEPSPQATKEATPTGAFSTFDHSLEPNAKYPYTPCPGYPFYSIRDVAEDEDVNYVMLKLREDSDEGRVFASLIEKGTSDDAAAERLAYMRQHAHDKISYVSVDSSFIELEGKRYLIKIKSPEGQKLQDLQHEKKFDAIEAYYKEHAHSVEDLRNV